jgi:hypothetical protein
MGYTHKHALLVCAHMLTTQLLPYVICASTLNKYSVMQVLTVRTTSTTTYAR